jgi:heat-inducible transcriptional repressor
MTPRQEKILEAIIEAYAEVASPVGSVNLTKVFHVSSATIRSEMADLEELGYIYQPFKSAGRIPTDKGYRFYVNNLNNHHQAIGENSFLRNRNRAISSRLEDGGSPERMIRNAVDTMVELTHNLGIGTIGNQLYLSGISNLFGNPEFLDPNQVKEVARLLDNMEPWLREASLDQPLSVYIGQENPIGASSGCSLIISKFKSPFSDSSYIGLLGPTRQNYYNVIDLVKTTGKMLEEIINER